MQVSYTVDVRGKTSPGKGGKGYKLYKERRNFPAKTHLDEKHRGKDRILRRNNAVHGAT